MLKRLLLVLLCLCLALPFAQAETAEEPLPENVEMEGFAGDDEEDVGEIYDEPASIEGLTPLYTARIKPFTPTGTAIRMREQQSSDSGSVCVIKKNEEITVYKVYSAST